MVNFKHGLGSDLGSTRKENRPIVILGSIFSGVGICGEKFFLPRHFNV